MAGRNSLAGGDRLARGARSATFVAGGAKKNEKIQINQGTLASDETRKELDKLTAADIAKSGPAKAAPVMKRTPRPLYDRVVIRVKKAEERISSIIVPDEAKDKERPREGVVVFVGNGKVEMGDEVALIGELDGQGISADEVAALEDTISYEVVCSIGKRVPRVYK